MKPERTINDFLDELEQDDLTVTEWARKKGLSISATYAVVSGRSLGRRGAPRKIMKEMGLSLPPTHRTRAEVVGHTGSAA